MAATRAGTHSPLQIGSPAGGALPGAFPPPVGVQGCLSATADDGRAAKPARRLDYLAVPREHRATHAAGHATTARILSLPPTAVKENAAPPPVAGPASEKAAKGHFHPDRVPDGRDDRRDLAESRAEAGFLGVSSLGVTVYVPK